VASISRTLSGSAGERIQRQQDFLGLFFRDIQDQNRHQLVGSGGGTQMPVDQLHVGKFARQERVCVSDFLKETAQHVLLKL
jgi:hypothetical protein